MANLKEIRSRITSVHSTRQITSAMKMVSAAKLKRAQDAITQMRPYANKLQGILANVSATLDGSEGVYSQEREVKNVLLIAITSNRGLCGGFNNNVIKKVNGLIAEHKDAHVNVLSLGKKAFDLYKKSDRHCTAEHGYPAEPFEIFNNLNFTDASNIANVVMEKFKTGQLDKVYLVFNSFKNAAVQQVKTQQFLPMLPEDNADQTNNTDYIFEPNKEVIIEELIPKSLKIQFYSALLDSHAGEHGARMTAMHKATDNATDLLGELKLTYNKARQAAITNEILEIVGGAEALNG